MSPLMAVPAAVPFPVAVPESRRSDGCPAAALDRWLSPRRWAMLHGCPPDRRWAMLHGCPRSCSPRAAMAVPAAVIPACHYGCPGGCYGCPRGDHDGHGEHAERAEFRQRWPAIHGMRRVLSERRRLLHPRAGRANKVRTRFRQVIASMHRRSGRHARNQAAASPLERSPRTLLRDVRGRFAIPSLDLGALLRHPPCCPEEGLRAAGTTIIKYEFFQP